MKNSVNTNIDDPLLFLRQFLRRGTQVASISPSSRRLALTLCAHITPERPQLILELGAGTGAVTAVALERIHPESTLMAVEIDSDFTKILRQRCPGVQVLEADATTIDAELRARSITQVDLVISGLPIPSLPKQVNQAILAGVGQRLGAGYFSQLTVMPWVYLPLYRALFHEVRFTPVWWNLPCGGVYHCRQLRTDFADHLPTQK